METIGSESVFEGFCIGTWNERNRNGLIQTKSRYAGGREKRKKQEKHLAIADRSVVEWPKAASCLRKLAEDYGYRAKIKDGEAELRKRR